MDVAAEKRQPLPLRLARAAAGCFTHHPVTVQRRVTRPASELVLARIRLLAAFVLVQLVAGQALSAVHHALVRHVVCPVHGVLEHVPAQGRAKYVTGSVAKSERSSATPGSAESHEHDACGVLLTSAHRAVESESVVAVEVSGCVGFALVPSFERATAYLPEVLSNAPKRSPPA